MSPRCFWLLLCLLLLLSFAKRFATFSLGPAPIGFDAAEYWGHALEVAEGDWLLLGNDIDYRTPLYPLFLGVYRRVFGPYALMAVVVTQHFLLLLANLLTAVITWRVTRSRVATLVAYALAVRCLMRAVSANYILTEPLFIFFLTLTVGALAEYHLRPCWRWAITFGLLLAMTVLVRPVPKLLWIPLCVVFFLHGTGWVEQRIPWRRIVGHVLAVAVVTAVACLPWYVRNWIVFEDLFLARLPAVNKWEVCFQGGSASRLPIPKTPAGRRLLELIGDANGEIPDRYCSSVIHALEQKGLSNAEIDTLVSEVCLQAIREHPLEFGWPTFKRFVNFWRTGAGGLPYYDECPPEFEGHCVWRFDRVANAYEKVLRKSPVHFLLWNEFVMVLVAVGTLGMIWGRHTRALGLSLAMSFLYFAAVTAVVEIENYRYRMILEPCMWVAVVCGFQNLVAEWILRFLPATRSGDLPGSGK